MSSSDGRPILMLGGGGHARVLQDTLARLGLAIAGFVAPSAETKLVDVEWLGPDESLARRDAAVTVLVNGVGSVGDSRARRAAWDAAKSRGFTFLTVVDPSAIVGAGASLGEGAQLLARSVVGADTAIGPDTIVNTGAIVEHHGRVGAHAHVASGAVLGGGVRIGESTHVGLGASVIQGLSVGDRAVVGAGAAVVRDVASGHLAVGVPARSSMRSAAREA